MIFFYYPVIANAILDSVPHHAHVVSINVNSYRLKDHLNLECNLVPLYYKKKNFGRCLELIRDMNDNDPVKTINEITSIIICKNSTKRYWCNDLSINEKKDIIKIIKEPKELFIDALSIYIDSVKEENEEIDMAIIEYIKSTDDMFKKSIEKNLNS